MKEIHIKICTIGHEILTVTLFDSQSYLTINITIRPGTKHVLYHVSHIGLYYMVDADIYESTSIIMKS